MYYSVRAGLLTSFPYMKKNNRNRLLSVFRLTRLSIRGMLTFFLLAHFSFVTAQEKNIDGQNYTKYKPGYFKPKRGLNYSLYVAPVLTVDPLGIGGKSTYALSVGSQFRLWESKTPDNALRGLHVKGWYTAIGYEYYPQQFDNLYASLWFRVKTFMPLAARVDGMYSFGETGRGLSIRYCFGIEIKRITILACGVYTKWAVANWGWHPSLDSPYTNVGAITILIPFYNHFPSDK